MVSGTRETGYHKRERERGEAAAERGQILTEAARHSHVEPGGAFSSFFGIQIAIAEWVAGILRRRRARKSEK